MIRKQLSYPQLRSFGPDPDCPLFFPGTSVHTPWVGLLKPYAPDLQPDLTRQRGRSAHPRPPRGLQLSSRSSACRHSQVNTVKTLAIRF